MDDLEVPLFQETSISTLMSETPGFGTDTIGMTQAIARASVQHGLESATAKAVSSAEKVTGQSRFFLGSMAKHNLGDHQFLDLRCYSNPETATEEAAGMRRA